MAALGHHTNIQSSLKSLFISECLEGVNAPFCHVCSSKQDADSCFYICEVGNYLIVQLKHFLVIDGVVSKYAVPVICTPDDDLPDIESFTLYRSFTNKDTIKFTKEKLPAILEEYIDEEDLYYRKWLEEKEVTMYNFADLLVADLNLISQSMIAFCNNHALERNRGLDESRLNMRALKQEAIAKHLPCCICKQFFASYTYDSIMNGGVDKAEFKNMIHKEYQVSYRETILMKIKGEGQVKDGEYLNKLVDDCSKKIVVDLEEFITVTLT